MQALQVEPVAPSLNSSSCYILHNDSSVLTWTGNLTTSEDQELMERQLDLIESNSFPFLPWFCYCKNLRSSAGNLKRTNLVSQEFKRDRDRCIFSSFCPQEACFLG
ncbi:VILLIN [Salix purpurea]|uniref:VILLIN n=1 Tax=Salix purpurea TaxID=77065 RepID=A0A9Q0SVV8_SALPP|nr:VILLIN [Salix purpurea]